MKKSDESKEIMKALLKSQIEIKQPKKDSKNPYHKSMYADLSSCYEACKEILNGNGIFISQTNSEYEKGTKLITTLTHVESDQFISTEICINFIMPPDKNHTSERIMTPQDCGSAITYFRRYSLCNILMLCPEDDDGNACSTKPKDKAQEQLISHMIGPNQIDEIKSLISKCPPGFELWLLQQVITDEKVEKCIKNIPLSAFNFCKTVTQTQINKQNQK